MNALSFAETPVKVLETAHAQKLTECAQWTVLESYLDNLADYEARNWVSTLFEFQKGRLFSS
jgi:hypothetical protein